MLTKKQELFSVTLGGILGLFLNAYLVMLLLGATHSFITQVPAISYGQTLILSTLVGLVSSWFRKPSSVR